MLTRPQAAPAGGFLHTKARAVHQHRPLRSMLFVFFNLPLFPALFACLSALCFPFLPVARLLLLRTCVGFCTRLKHGFVPFRKIFAEHRRIPHQELILDQSIAASDFINAGFRQGIYRHQNVLLTGAIQIRISHHISFPELPDLYVPKLRIRNFDAAYKESMPLDIALCQRQFSKT